tara:strand:- start:3526 stop:5361 length:1836 start_codon:yes stop_codon:yes gene_type:complete
MVAIQEFIKISPIISLIVSLTMILGLHQIGGIFLKFYNLQILISKIINIDYFKIPFAINILMAFLFPIVLWVENSIYLIYLISVFIFICGLYIIFNYVFFSKKFFNRINKTKNRNFHDILLFLLLISLFLISFGPVTHSDSIDYHVNVAKFIAQTGNFPISYSNFHNFLAGSGEVMMSLGYVFGSEQFGNFIQFSGLLLILGIFFNINNKNKFFLLIAITSPVILFLLSSPKPQFFAICTNFFIFYMIFLKKIFFKIKKKQSLIILIIIFLFLSNSLNTKFSFLLSGFILIMLLFKIVLEKKILKEFLFTGILIFFISVFPYILWKFINHGGSFFSYFYNPLPMHIEGMTYFKNYLTNYKRENSILFLFIPKQLGQITDVLGLGLIILLALKEKLEDKKIFLSMISLFVFLGYFFGQPSGRFFYEPYIWTIGYLAYHLKPDYYNNSIRQILNLQFLIICIMSIYGAIILAPGAINNDLKHKVMNSTANGYALFNWSNSLIGKDETVIAMHRSVSLGKSTTLSTNFTYYTKPKDEKIIKKILQEYDQKNPKYLLTYQLSDNFGIFENCIDYLYAKKDNVGFYAGRNPFNNNDSKYNGYLYKLKELSISKCIF